MGEGLSLTYVCDWLPPDFGAVGQYSVQFAREYAERDGRHVTLVGLTSGAPRVTTETLGHGTLKIVRLAAAPVPKDRLWRRMIWTLHTNLRLLATIIGRTPLGGAVLFTGSPPFLLLFISPFKWLLGYRLTYRITDFYPECLMVTMERVPWPLRLLYRVTVFLRRRVDTFQVVGEDQRRRLNEIGIDDDRIVVKRDPSPVAFSASTRPLPRPRGAGDAALLLYSGNYGVAHDIDTFVEGYIRHHRDGNGRVLLWLNASGSGVAEVVERLRAADCPLILGRAVPLKDLASLLVTPDAHLITLKDRFVGLVMPSKVYGCVESGRDVLFIGSTDSDVDLIARTRSARKQQYLQVPVGDVNGVACALDALGAATGARCGTAGPAPRRTGGPLRLP